MKRRLTNSLKQELANHANHYTPSVGGRDVISRGVDAKMSQMVGNPDFVSQFDLNVRLVYSAFNVSLDEGNPIPYIASRLPSLSDPATIDESLKNKLPVFLFGNSDFGSGFKNMKSQSQLSNWTQGEPYIVRSKDQSFPQAVGVASSVNIIGNAVIKSPAVSNGLSEEGDLIIPYYHQTADLETGATLQIITLCEVVVSCQQVGYGTLLDAISSDRFIFNAIRYNIPDETKLNQYQNPIKLLKQTLFGKISTDTLQPNSFKNPQNFLSNVIDIPLKKGVDKESGLSIDMNYDVGEIQLSFFVPVQNKLVQDV